MGKLPFVDPYTCEHQVGEIRRAKLREIPGAVERTVWFRCAKCGCRRVRASSSSSPARS